jgi:hypothetical protein
MIRKALDRSSAPPGHLQRVIDRLMPFAETITSIVLSSVVTSRVVEPAAEPTSA